MKRSRSEHIHVALGHYLRKRQFSDNETFKKAELKLHQTSQEMALRGLIANESSTRNAINLSSISGDIIAVDQQYTRLKTFISDAIEPFKSELTHILFPMFVHLYLELVNNGQKTPAQRFHSRHSSIFSDVPKYQLVVENLGKVITSQDLSNFTDIKAFRENKYTVILSDAALQYVLKYLKGNNHLILLQIFNFHIEVKDPSLVNLHLYKEKTSEDANANSTSSGKPSPESKPSPPSGTTKSLLQAIKKIQDGPPPLPSICLYTVTNTSFGLSSVALSSDTNLLTGGFEDSSIRLWNLVPFQNTSSSSSSSSSKEVDPNGFDISQIRLACDKTCPPTPSINLNHSNEMKVMRGHSGPIYGLSFTPDAKLLLSCSEDTTVRAWDLNSHKNVALYRGHNYPVWGIDCSSLGLYFATVSQDRTAKLWSLDRTYPLRIMAGHNMDVDSVKFHPNCNYIATGSTDRTVRLWSIQDGKMVRLFQGHRGTVFALAFSPNGQFLASAGEDRRIKIWDLAAGSLMKELRGHLDTVYSLCFNRDSTVLISGGLDNTVRVWDIRKGISFSTTVDSHASPELLGIFPTKSTSLLSVQYSVHNLLLAVGTQP